MFMMKFTLNMKTQDKTSLAEEAAGKDKNPSNRTLHIVEPDYF